MRTKAHTVSTRPLVFRGLGTKLSPTKFIQASHTSCTSSLCGFDQALSRSARVWLARLGTRYISQAGRLDWLTGSEE